MPEPLVQTIKSVYDSQAVKAYIADLERIKTLEGATGRSTSSGRRVGPSPQSVNAVTAALQRMKATLQEAKNEFKLLDNANRRQEISNENFARSVEALNGRTRRALGGVAKEFKELPPEVVVALNKADVALDTFATRAREVETGSSRLRRAVGDGIADGARRGRIAVFEVSRALEDMKYGVYAAANNANRLTEIFGAWRARGASARDILKSMLAVFRGPAGLLVIVSVAISLISTFGDKIVQAFNRGQKSAKELKEAVEEIIKIKFEPISVEVEAEEARRELAGVQSAIKSLEDARDRAFVAAQAAAQRHTTASSVFTKAQQQMLSDLKLLEGTLKAQLRKIDLQQYIGEFLAGRNIGTGGVPTLEEEIKLLKEEKQAIIDLANTVVHVGPDKPSPTEDLKRINREIAEKEERLARLNRLGLPDESALRKAQQERERAEEFLRKSAGAAEIASRMTDREKKALGEIFQIQEEIVQLKEVENTLGATAAADALADAERRLMIARLQLENAEAFRAKVKEAADSFEGLAGRGVEGPLEEAARRQRLEEAQARKERKAAHEEAIKFTAAEEDALKKLEEQIDRNREAWTFSWEILEDLAATVDGIVRLVDVFGDLSEEARQAAAGIADALDSAARLRDLQASGASGLALLPAGLGIAGGMFSALFSLRDAIIRTRDERAEEHRRELEALGNLRKQLKESAQDIRRSVRDLVEASQPLSEFTGQQIEQGRAAITRFEGFGAGGDVRTLLLDLQRAGFDVQEFLDFYQGAVQAALGRGLTTPQAMEEARSRLFSEAGFADLLELIKQGLGTFSDTVSGVIDEFNLLRDFLHLEGQPAFEAFLEGLSQIEGLPADLLSQLQALNISTPEGRAALNTLLGTVAAAIAAGTFDFGGLTPEEVRQILDALQPFIEGELPGASGTGGSTIAGLQRQVIVTEVQANAIYRVLLSIERIALDGAESLRRIAGRTGAPTPPSLPTPQAPVFQTSPVFAAPDIQAIRRAGSGGVMADFSGWTIQRPIDEGHIETGRKISRMVLRQWERAGRGL